MDDSIELINRWAYVAHMSQILLDLAQLGEWEQLLGREEDYLRSVEAVMRNQSTAVSQATQSIIEGHLKKALENELLLENLLHRRLDSLGQLIGQSVRQRSINTAYGGISGLVLVPDHDSTTH